MFVTLITATILDLLLAAFLVAISGLIFGPGPESANGEASAVMIWVSGVAFCLIAPFAGFITRRRGQPVLAVLIAFAPLAAGVGFLVI